MKKLVMECLHLRLDLGVGLPLLAEGFSKSMFFMFVESIAYKTNCIFFVLNDCLKNPAFFHCQQLHAQTKTPHQLGRLFE